MEIIGDDKRIRALYSETRFADEQAAPSFTSVWHRAQSRSAKPTRAFNLAFVSATAILVVAVASLAIWLKYSQPRATFTASANVAALASLNPPTSIKVTRAVTPAPTVVRSRLLKLTASKESSITAA